MDIKPALLFALLAQLSFSYLAMSGDKLASGTVFQATVEGANYADVPYGLANVTAYGRSGEPLNFSVTDGKLYFTGGYARIRGAYPAWVCDYSYMPRAVKGAEKDTFIVDICSDGRPVWMDGFTFTSLPKDRKMLGIVYYPYYVYGEENVTRLASYEEPLSYDVLNYTYSGGVLRVNQRLLVNPSNWSNIFLLIFEDPQGAQADSGVPQADSRGTSSSVGGMLLPFIALLVSIPIALVVWSRYVCR